MTDSTTETDGRSAAGEWRTAVGERYARIATGSSCCCDAGSGGESGFDCLRAAREAGASGRVVAAAIEGRKPTAGTERDTTVP